MNETGVEEDSPSLRRSARKRKSLSDLPDLTPIVNKRAKGKKMSVSRTPIGSSTGKRQDQTLAPPVLNLDGGEEEAQKTDHQQERRELLVGIREMMGGMLGPLEERLSKQVSNLEGSVTSIKNGLTNLEARVGETERTLEEKITTIVDQRLGSVQALAALDANGGECPLTRDMRYWRSRKSLRIWPVNGRTEEELLNGAVGFLHDRLKLDEGMLTPKDKFAVRRIAQVLRSTIKDEVCVVFPSMELRDIAKGNAFNLAGDKAAGVRLEISHHLRKFFQALQTASYRLRKKFTECKRNVRFDDEKADLVLDFKTSPTSNWRKLRPSEAKAIWDSNQNEEMTASSMIELFEEDTDDTLTGVNAIELVS